MKRVLCLSLALGSAALAAPTQLNLTASKSGYGGPTSVAAGLTNVTLHNTAAMPIGAQLFKLRPGVTSAQVLRAIDYTLTQHKPDGDAKLAALIEAYGGPADTAPGTTSAAEVVLTPGEYLVVSMGSDDATHKTYPSMGYRQDLTVTGSAGATALPKADYTARLVDYRFEMPNQVKAGTHSWNVVNAGQEPHFMFLAKIKPGKTMQDVMAAMQSQKGEPPVDFQHATGTQALTTGRANVVSLNLTPGRYFVACFITSPKTGKDHAAMGMVKELTVAP